jgi:hypothetical protein
VIPVFWRLSLYMAVVTVLAQDATGTNQSSIPSGTQAAGYDTGSGGIAWSSSDYSAHTKPFPAVHIDQDAGASDHLSDILDVESGAATAAECPGWVKQARANYDSAARPGQRWPGIYCSESTVAAVQSALSGAGITDVPFWVAAWGIGEAQAQSNVANGGSGPYPTIGWQYESGSAVDYDVFSVPWLTLVSGPAQLGWNWCSKCQGLFYGWNSSKGRCPAGGAHSSSGSGDYSITHNAAPSGYQADWNWCGKCQGFFYGPQQANSVCPAGATHDGRGSGNYAVPHAAIPPGYQSRWSWCSKCRGMFYSPDASASHCPAGATHDGSTSYDYGLKHV